MMRQTALTEAVELQGQRIASAIAMPLWQAWIGILQQARTYLNDNGESLAAAGEAFVGLTTDAGEFVRVLGGICQLN